MRSLFHDNYLIIQLTPASALACVSPPIDPLLPEMPARNGKRRDGMPKEHRLTHIGRGRYQC